MEKIEASAIKITHRMIGEYHVLTSPDVPELHVANVDKQVAYDSVQATLDMIGRMKERLTLAQSLFEKDGNPPALWHAIDEQTRLFYRLEAIRQSRAPALPDPHQSTDQAHVAAPRRAS